MNINKESLKEFRKDLDEIIKPLEEKYGVTIDLGSISFSDIEFSTKINVKNNEINGKSVEQYEFEKVCHLYGFKPEDYGKEFKQKDETFKFVGFNINSPKYKYKCVNEKGIAYKFPSLPFKKEEQ